MIPVPRHARRHDRDPWSLQRFEPGAGSPWRTVAAVLAILLAASGIAALTGLLLLVAVAIGVGW